ncbi:MAG: pentapeptide repeat-containing protein [Nitrososphaeraceae archaeon]
MQEHYVGKKERYVEGITSSASYKNQLFINDGLDRKLNYELIKFEKCTFSKIGFREVKFNNTQFNHCVFIGCYFQQTKFKNITFSNCIFIKCGFYNCDISFCDFFYTEWENTVINYKDVKHSLPEKHNLRKKLCRKIANEWLKVGDFSEFKLFFFESKSAQEQQYKAIFRRKEDYYKQRYDAVDSVINLFKYILSKFEKYVWGYGEKLNNVIWTSFIIITLFSGIYYFSPKLQVVTGNKVLTSLYISITYFLTLSCDITYTEPFYRIVTSIEGFFGIALMGFFVAALYRRINSR